MSGRKRSAPGGATKAQIAAAINARRNARFPYSKYGAAHYLRGSEGSLSKFGSSFSAATPYQKSVRRATGFVGRGKYSLPRFINDLKLVEPIADRFINKGMPKMISTAKSLMGRGMYSGRGLYDGRGSYSNITMAGSGQSVPSVTSAGDETGSICISNREYVGDVFGPATSGTFDVTPFPLNPGLEQSFPWLSQLAANYEEYEFIQLVYELKSSIQDVNSANGQVGTIISATNYNASQPLFTDKPSMSAYYGSVSSKTTDDFVHGIECDPSKLSGAAAKYVRTNPVLTGEDLKSYDHGIFQIATHNIPSTMLNGTLGELFVSYKVMLRKPKFLTGRGLSITRALFVSGGSEGILAVMGTDALLLKGQQNNLNVLLDLSVSNAIKVTFPAYFAGNVEIKLCFEGTSMVGQIGATPTLTGQISFVSDIYGSKITGGSDSPTYSLNTPASDQQVFMCHVRVQPATNAVNNTLTILGALTAGTITQASLDICEYNSSFNKSGPTGAPVLVNTAGTVVVP